jgi:hypothetical protein
MFNNDMTVSRNLHVEQGCSLTFTSCCCVSCWSASVLRRIIAWPAPMLAAVDAVSVVSFPALETATKLGEYGSFI